LRGFKFHGFREELETSRFQVPSLKTLTKKQVMELETSGFKFHSFFPHQTGPKKELPVITRIERLSDIWGKKDKKT